MRIDLDTCRDPDLLAGEVRRLRAAIASEQRLTDEERAALMWFAHYGLPEHRAAALRGLLERTLTTHTKPDDGSVQESVT